MNSVVAGINAGDVACIALLAGFSGFEGAVFGQQAHCTGFCCGATGEVSESLLFTCYLVLTSGRESVWDGESQRLLRMSEGGRDALSQ